jgi:hypothetical protein
VETGVGAGTGCRERRRAWLLDDSLEVVEPTEAPANRARLCALPECEWHAVGGSVFCLEHRQTAVGEAGARELRQLQRELERMATISGTEAKAHAIRKFRSRVEKGAFAVLFSRAMDELIEQTADDTRLVMELDVLRGAMLVAYRQIEDPEKMAMMVSRIARASTRLVRADADWRKGRE